MIVGLVQVNMGLTWSSPSRDDLQGEEAPSYGLLPYSAGLLEAYARRNAVDGAALRFLPPVYRREPVEVAARRLAEADVVGFSTYVWNLRLSLAIARRVKELQPEALVVFGGPQVPDRAEAFLREHPFVDVACHGEGEATFTRLLDRFGAGGGLRGFHDVPGISFLDGPDGRGGGTLVANPKAPRIPDLASIPSPYLDGAFDALMAQHPDERWVVLWETNRGCPFSCSFCDWGSATQSKVFRFEEERLHGEIDWIAANKVEFVFCCDANFGMLPRDLELARAVVRSKQERGYPAMLSVQNTKNATDRAYAVQTLLASELNSLGVTISLQSTSPETLAAINRQNISSESFRELQRRFAADGVYTYTDLIVGLPGEPYATFAKGISDVIESGQHNHIQFHDCSVLPNAELAQPATVERFGIETHPQVIPTWFVPQMADSDGSDWTEEVPEYLDLVVATKDMPREDWVRAKQIAWAADLYYFDRLLQVPLAVASHAHGVRVHELLEALLAADAERFPTLAWVAETLAAKARRVQQGESSYFPAEGPTGRPWSSDQYALVRLVLDGRVDALYREAERCLAEAIGPERMAGWEPMLADCCELNRALLRVPSTEKDAWLALDGSLWEHYQSLLAGEPEPLERGLRFYRVDRTSRRWATIDAWYDHLLWCQKDKRVYLHAMRADRARARARVAEAADAAA